MKTPRKTPQPTICFERWVDNQIKILQTRPAPRPQPVGILGMFLSLLRGAVR